MAKTFDQYDERMLPMFEKLAEEAERRGYCGHYDDIAAFVGAPSRAEIRRRTHPLPDEDGLYVALAQAEEVSYPLPSLRLWKRLSGTWYRIRTGSDGGTGGLNVFGEEPGEPVTRLVVA